MVTNLAEISTNFIDFAVEEVRTIDLDWISKIIQWIINGVGIIGVGIIVFTLILKTVFLPLDIYSRVKMKQQSLIMKKMRPQMEKLQKQYANDKQMYSMKVRELQKESGVSVLSSCLPVVISLVIFMQIFSSFSTYSNYVNLSMYNDMVKAYNGSVSVYVIEGEGKGFLIQEEDSSIGENAYRVDFEKYENFSGEKLEGKSESEKISAVRKYVKNNARQAAADYYRKHGSGFLWIGSLWYPDSMFNKEYPNFENFKKAIQNAIQEQVDSYEDSYNEVSFYLINEGYPSESGKIEGNKFNGYFVLILLSVGLMFLQQFISMRSQKDANELGTVDGSAAKSTKMMMIMMPVIFGAISFMYSAAFSIYMVVGSIHSLIFTVIINKIMDAKFAKAEENGGYQIKKENNVKRKRLK